MSNSTMYATLRFRRRPISNDIVCLRLVCNTALPAHKDPAHVEEISDYATRQQVAGRETAYCSGDIEYSGNATPYYRYYNGMCP